MKTDRNNWPLTIDTDEPVQPHRSYWVATPEWVDRAEIISIVKHHDGILLRDSILVDYDGGQWDTADNPKVAFAESFEAAHAEWTKMQEATDEA